MRIRVKLGLIVILIALIAAIPLSFYILHKAEQEKIEQTISFGKISASLIAKAAKESYIKEGGDPIDAGIEARDNIAIFKDQFKMGLAFTQTILLTRRHKGVILSQLANSDLLHDNNTIEKYVKLYQSREALPLTELETLQKSAEYRDVHCEKNISEICFFEFLNTSIQVDPETGEKIPVVLSHLLFSKNFVLAPIRKLKIFVLIAASIAVLGSIFIGYLFSRSITYPLQRLKSGVDAYGEGNFEARVDVRSRDELGELGVAFNAMSERIAAQIKEIAEHRDHLEEKVEERTRELKNAFERITSLKEQQDGDYLLTSLLINPLAKNTSTAKNIKVDFYTNQKKKFQFRKWAGEIGGDISISADLFFIHERRKIPYTFIINGDAMGKSLQGAGGAIVFGTAIQSLIGSAQKDVAIAQPPNAWLVAAFKQLNNIFLQFEGSMLMSACFILINNVTGKTYYINAEHPFGILYRSNKAYFFEKELMSHKLGTAFEFSQIEKAREFTLKDGDILIVGSDGRDDIELASEDDYKGEERRKSARNINEDETLILRRVEEGNGNLPQIAEYLMKSGTLTDDLSFVRIEFTKLAVDKKAKEKTTTENLV